MNNNRLSTILILLSLSGGIAVCIYIFTLFFERYEESEDIGWTAKAHVNPYLAAEDYLKRQGVAAEHLKNADSFDTLEGIGTLFISNSRSIISAKSLNNLLSWVEEGGHLIVGAKQSTDNSDFLLNYFELSVEDSNYADECHCDTPNESLEEKIEKSIDDDDVKLSDEFRKYNEEIRDKKANKVTPEEDPDVPDDALQEEILDEVSDDQKTLLSFDDIDESIEIHFNVYTEFHHPYFAYRNNLDEQQNNLDEPQEDQAEEYQGTIPIYWRGSDYGAHFMQFEHGGGLVTVMTDSEIWLNDRIDKTDHAYLLSLLVDKDNGMRFLSDFSMPSITRLMTRYGFELLISGLLLLLTWLWYTSRRFGPITTLSNDVRRSMAEHIYASGLYLWRHRWSKDLLEPMRHDIIRSARQQFPNFDHLSAEEQFQKIGQHTNLDTTLIAQSMTTNVERNEEDFCTVVKRLQKIKESL